MSQQQHPPPAGGTPQQQQLQQQQRMYAQQPPPQQQMPPHMMQQQQQPGGQMVRPVLVQQQQQQQQRSYSPHTAATSTSSITPAGQPGTPHQQQQQQRNVQMMQQQQPHPISVVPNPQLQQPAPQSPAPTNITSNQQQHNTNSNDSTATATSAVSTPSAKKPKETKVSTPATATYSNSAAAPNAKSATNGTSSSSTSTVNPNSSSTTGGGDSATSIPSAKDVGSAMSSAALTVQHQQLDSLTRSSNKPVRKKGKLRDKIIPQRVRELVPDSESYMDLLAFERKLDATIARKRLDIQEALKRLVKTKRKLRVFITNQFYPGETTATASSTDNDNSDSVPQWELKIEGRLLDETKGTDNLPLTLPSSSSSSSNNLKVKPRKFSSFFKSLVIELDKDLYGPDNHLVEWHRTPQTAETDGFQVKRHGDQSLKCTILMLLDYQPLQYKLDSRLAKLLGIHTASRPHIIQSLWQYIKVHKLQDAREREHIILDKYLAQIFECERIRFSDIPGKLHSHCMPPDPIAIQHSINIDLTEPKRTSIYEIDVEVDDVLRDQMKSFLSTSQTSQLAEVGQLDAKINEHIEQLNQLRVNREFFQSFSEHPQAFINKWLISQSNDLKSMLDLHGSPEDERKASFYHEAWTDEAVCRYFYNRVQQRRAELEQVLGIRS